MAVVFISPKQRQKMFFSIITAMLLIFLLIIFFGVFMAKPKEVPAVLVFNKPKITIDMKIFDSDQFKNLQALSDMKIQYSYTAAPKGGKSKTGFITAASKVDATAELEAQGLFVSAIEEVVVGRINPFTPYYAQVPTLAQLKK